MDKQPVIHIGFPKAASTFLQHKIFPNVPGYIYLNRRYRGEIGDKYRNMLFDTFFNETPPDHPFADINGEPFVYSGEQFLHYPRNAWTHKNQYPMGIDFRSVGLANLKRIFRDRGKFLIITRRQDDAISSFLNFNQVTIESEQTIFVEQQSGKALYLSGFNYYELAIDLVSVVGPDRVCFLPFEEISANPQRFLSRLEKVFQTKLTGLDEAFGTPVNVSEKIHLRENFAGYLEYYAASNRLLDEMFSLGLDELGYY